MAKRVVFGLAAGTWLMGAAACSGGSEGQTVKDQLIGSWGNERRGDAEALLIEFYDDGGYQHIVGRASGIGSLEMQITLGDYHLQDGKNGLNDDDDGSYLVLEPFAASCPGGAPRESFSVSFPGNSLKLGTEEYAIILDALPEQEGETDEDDYSGGLVATYGCFTVDGFIPSPVEAF